MEKYTYTPFGKTTIHTPVDTIWGNEDDTTLDASAYGNPCMFTARGDLYHCNS